MVLLKKTQYWSTRNCTGTNAGQWPLNRVHLTLVIRFPSKCEKMHYTDPVTLTYYLSIPKPYHHLYDIPTRPKVISKLVPSLMTLGSFVFELGLCCGQTNTQTDRRGWTLYSRDCRRRNKSQLYIQISNINIHRKKRNEYYIANILHRHIPYNISVYNDNAKLLSCALNVG